MLGCATVGLTGCTSIRVPVPDLGALVPVGLTGPRVRDVDIRTPEQRAQACVQEFDPKGKAPQVMTYDSNTKTEVHMNTEGRSVDVTAQNSTDNTAMGMGGKVGGRIPEACTDADPLPGAARGHEIHVDHVKQSWEH
ncbi:MAG: hypothetical protein ACXWKW_01265 [Asticcacaulis sp.]